MDEPGVPELRGVELWADAPKRSDKLLALVSLAALAAAWRYFMRAQALERSARTAAAPATGLTAPPRSPVAPLTRPPVPPVPTEPAATPEAAPPAPPSPVVPLAPAAPPAAAGDRPVRPVEAPPSPPAATTAAPDTPTRSAQARAARDLPPLAPVVPVASADALHARDEVAQRSWSAARLASSSDPQRADWSLAADPSERPRNFDTNGARAHTDPDDGDAADPGGGVATLLLPLPNGDDLGVLPRWPAPTEPVPGPAPAPGQAPAPGPARAPGPAIAPSPEPGSIPPPSWASVARPSGPQTGARVGTRTAELPWVLTVFAVAGLALALRLINHSTNYDVFIDEISYSTIGQAITLGHGVSLYGTPFFLHPPLFFYLEAGVLELFGGAHDAPLNLVLALRPLDCVLGAIECGLVMLLMARLTNRTAAVVAGVFVACDPFLQLWDGRVLLETPAMALAVLGWLALARVARREDAGSPAERTVVVLGGLCFGASLMTKETYAFVGVAPLLAMAVLGSPVRRWVSAVMGAVALSCYAIYLLVIVAEGHWSGFYNQQLAGVLRAVGTKQITGFNQKGHAGFSSRAGADLLLYGVTYVVIVAIGLAAAAGVLTWLRSARSGRTLTRQRRLAIALGAGGVGYVTYAVGFGAFETQIFYMSIVAGLPVLATETTAMLRRPASARRRRAWVIAAAVLAAAGLAFELATDVRIRSSTDSDIPRLVAYIDHHVPYLSLVDSTDGVTQFVLQDVRIDGPRTVAGLERDRPDYIVIAQGLVDQGYVTLGPGFERWLHEHARVVFDAHGRTVGQLLLYRTRYAPSRTPAATGSGA